MSSASGSGCLRVVGESRDGNLDQSATLNDGALSAPGNKKVGASNVEEELAVCSPVARSSVVRSSVVPNLVSYRTPVVDGVPCARIEMRMLGDRWVEPDPVSHEWSAWCRPNIRRPMLSRPPSLDVGPPNVGNAPRSVPVGEDDRLHVGRVQYPGVEDLIKPQFDDVLVQPYGYPNNGEQLFPSCTPLYNKFVGRVPATDLGNLTTPVRLRNVRIGRPAIANRLHVGEIVRFESHTLIRNLEGRKTNTWCSAMDVKDGHHVWRAYYAPNCIYNLPLPTHCRIVCIDTCKLRWCSIDNVAFHSFAWPRGVKEAKGIARTLFTNQCNWADVLIVHGRCFSSSKVCFRANRMLEDLLWNWSKMRRPYVVYREGNDGIGDCDPVPAWLAHECVHRDFCQCHLVGSRHQNCIILAHCVVMS